MKDNDITVVDLEKMIREGNTRVLDVRTLEERMSGYINGSVNIDFYDENFRPEIEKLDRSETYVVYCASGGRSSKTVRMMEEIGFTDCHNLSGGFGEWTRAGMKVVK